MAKITLTFSSGTKIIAQSGCAPVEFLEKIGTGEILAVKVNNKIASLESPIEVSAKIEAVYATSREGAAIYRRSLCFLLAAATNKLFPLTRLLVGHSLGYGYYYTLGENPPSDEKILALKNEMKKIVSQNLPIRTEFLSYEQACELFEKMGLVETRKQLNYDCPSKIKINKINDFSEPYFGPLASFTGILGIFDLMKYQDGFLLRFPSHDSPKTLEPFKDEPKLFEIYKRYKEWGKRLSVTSTASLNQIIHDREADDFINITETLQNKCISEIADKIKEKKSARVVLIAGPSSSGKTTTSKKLSLQLKAIGYNPKVISLDNYYVGRTETPRDENGNYDYECLEALNIEMLNENLVALFSGKEIKMPSYDFHAGVSYFKGNTMHLDENDILIMEGIHGLNDKLTPLVPSEKKFKIYLSALTQLNLDDHNRISTSDNRLIRRIVRDSKFRGKSAADTIAMWDNVQKGERLHIFPFQNNADAMLNTALDYELSVLKVYAAPLLRCVTPLQTQYSEATRLLQFLNCFSQIPATSVPAQSIIREFIGGSQFKY